MATFDWAENISARVPGHDPNPNPIASAGERDEVSVVIDTTFRCWQPGLDAPNRFRSSRPDARSID